MAQCTAPEIWTRHHAYHNVFFIITISPTTTKDIADLSQRCIGTLGRRDVGQGVQRVQFANNVVPYSVTMQGEHEIWKYGNVHVK